MAQGPLIILSGPAGSGKTTVVNRLLQEGKFPLRRSVSVTTRDTRKGEREGIDYYFWPREKFLAEKDAGSFVEWACVHGNYYGTPKSEVGPYLEQGIGVILVIDVQGAAQVRRMCPEAISVFLQAPSWEEYQRRMRKRGDDEATIARRLETARSELERMHEYDQVLVSDQVEATVARLHELIAQWFSRGSACSTS
jgi:guanylate kinase